MATQKDLVEAYSFGRRRLVTAFVSGAPGGREAEPARSGRTIVGGVVLAVLLAAGAAVAGVFAPRLPDDWNRPGLIVSKDTGAAYVIVDDGDDPELRPVINSTSARLILDGDAQPMLVEQGTIDEQRIGDDIGIFGAPASVPTPALLIDSGWTACTAAGAGIEVRVSDEPDGVTAPATGVTVTNGGDYFVVVPDDGGAVLLPVPAQGEGGNQTDNLLSALSLQTTGGAVPVGRDWIDLFPVGAPLDWDSFGLTGYGTTPAYAAEDEAGVLRGHHVGDLLAVGDGQLLLTESGPVQLTPFAALVYGNVVAPDDRVVAADPVGTTPRVRRGDPVLAGAGWPEAAPQGHLDEPCAQLQAAAGQTPTVRLREPGESSGATEVPAGQKAPVVASGRGAYVLSGGWGDSEQGSPFLIDAQGRADPLVGDGVAAALGYGDHPVAVVPDTWVKLFDCGVSLSRAAAGSPPAEQDDASCA